MQMNKNIILYLKLAHSSLPCQMEHSYQTNYKQDELPQIAIYLEAINNGGQQCWHF